MTGAMHVFCGVTTLGALTLKYKFHLEVNDLTVILPLSFITVSAGSYAPDIDQIRSHAGMKHKIASKIVRKTTGGHRNPWTHSLIVPISSLILTSLCYAHWNIWYYLQLVLSSILFGWTWGWFAHVMLDLFNGKGAPLLFPISKSKISLLDIPDHGFFAWLFTIIFSGIACYGIYMFL